MLTARKARETTDYINSKQRQEDIRKENVLNVINYLEGKVEELSSRGKSILKDTLSPVSNITISLIYSEDMGEVENHFKQLGFDVTTDYRELTIGEKDTARYMRFQGIDVENKVPKIEISW